jgi:lipooligosaccharide transport system permease protein
MATAALPVTGRLSSSRSFRAYQCWMTVYRRIWRSSIWSSLLGPLFYLGAMGLGLGSLVNRHGTASLGGVSYLAFVAPAILASGAMNTAMGEASYPVFGSIKWNKLYIAAQASPLRPGDIFRGHLLFVTLRLTMNCGIFIAVAAVLGAVQSGWIAAALPVAVLTGLAFAAPIDAWAVTRTKDTSFAVIFRFGMIPMFLFSGVFFPVTQLPGWIRPVAYLTPLWHGVAECRALSLGTATLGGSLVHVAYLALWVAAGVAAGHRTYPRRLYV